MTGSGRLTLVVLLLALVLVPLASADGDPASDILLAQDVYLPAPPPSSAVANRLTRDVADANAHGHRLKVAVIATANDLGAVPSLFRMPKYYAWFLGQEIQFLFRGPLLVVMPAGFGIYDGGRPTTAEKAILGRVPIKAGTADQLTATADVAVRALAAAQARPSKDVTAPYVAMLAATAKPGRTITLYFYVGDDSKQATATLQILDAGRPLATWHFQYASAILQRRRTAKWLVPRSVRKGTLQACLTASDPSGNRSFKACANIKVT